MPQTDKAQTIFVDPIDPDKESDIRGDALELEALCKRLGYGRVTDTHIEGDYDAGSISGYITLSVAPDKADALRQAIRAEGYRVGR